MRHSVQLTLVVLAAASARGLGAQAMHHHADSTATHDSAYAAMQQRGRMVMGVDQYTSTHHFDDLPDGGRITLVRNAADSVGAARIRTHLREIAAAFSAGDFSSPMLVHMTDVPGTTVMAAKKAMIHYSVRDLPRGAVVTISTHDPDAIRAVHDFLAFQRSEHHGP